MGVSNITCRNCLYEAPMCMFERKEHGRIKCRRCRGDFDISYERNATYADCDSNKPITCFPFKLNGNNSKVYVRNGYAAFVLGHDGKISWLKDAENEISYMMDGFRLYYVCLAPQITWGTVNLPRFGAYGIAHLVLESKYVESCLNGINDIRGFEKKLKTLVSNHITDYALQLVQQHDIALLRTNDGYEGALGLLKKDKDDNGFSLTKIELMGYHDGDNVEGTFNVRFQSFCKDEEESFFIPKTLPVTIAKPQQSMYTIEKGIEEVFVLNKKMAVHKAGEIIDDKKLKGVTHVLRFSTKVFEFCNGWGIYNQMFEDSVHYSAHGTISFLIDDTKLLSSYLIDKTTWAEFAESLFSDVLKNAMSAKLKDALKARASRKDFSVNRIDKELSALSTDVKERLNEETTPHVDPAFARYGLRVSTVEIINITFTSSGR